MEGSGLGNLIGPYKRGPEGDKFKQDELFSADVLLFGRRTYDGFAAVWPTIKDETGMADRMNALPKYVLTTTLKRADWNNSQILSPAPLDQISKIKAEDGGDILIYGSASLGHLLMQHGLVDEVRMMIYPTILGRGIRLFPENVKANLDLLECKQLGSGIVLLRYGVTN